MLESLPTVVTGLKYVFFNQDFMARLKSGNVRKYFNAFRKLKPLQLLHEDMGGRCTFPHWNA